MPETPNYAAPAASATPAAPVPPVLPPPPTRRIWPSVVAFSMVALAGAMGDATTAEEFARADLAFHPLSRFAAR